MLQIDPQRYSCNVHDEQNVFHRIKLIARSAEFADVSIDDIPTATICPQTAISRKRKRPTDITAIEPEWRSLEPSDDISV